MRYHKSKIFFSIILVLALFIGIGYAYLSTKLQIGGTTKVLKPSFAMLIIRNIFMLMILILKGL